MAESKHVKRLAAVFVAALMAAALAMLPWSAAESSSGKHAPSIFYNDEAWFKDEVLPSVMRDGYCYVPAEFFSMINYITYSVYDDDNILIFTADGKYISILFSDGSAVANGEYAGYVGIFRDSGVYYVRADDVAGPLDIQTEYCQDPENPAKSIIRFYDRETAFSLTELVNNYISPPVDPRYLFREDIPALTPDTKKKICFVITMTGDGSGEYEAWEMLETAGLKYTVFLDSESSVEEILKASYQGDYGLFQGEADLTSVGKAASDIGAYTLYRTRLLLADSESDRSAEFVKNGYIYITPDLHVNGNANAADIFSRILEIAERKHCCIIRLDDCWNSEQIIGMVQQLDTSEYSIVNLRGR